MLNEKQFTERVQLLSVQKLDFKTDSGDFIQGIKLYYLSNPDDRVKDNYIGGKIQDIYFNIPEFNSKFDMLRKHYNECISKKVPCFVNLVFILADINKKPRATDITL